MSSFDIVTPVHNTPVPEMTGDVCDELAVAIESGVIVPDTFARATEAAQIATMMADHRIPTILMASSSPDNCMNLLTDSLLYERRNIR
jgi:hypothetical protein